MSYISPPNSEEGGTPQVSLRPQLNESLFDQVRAVGFVPPENLFEPKGSRHTLESKQWGNAPFFINAKPASMLERGWVRSMTVLTGSKGLLAIKDGPEILVKIIRGGHLDPVTNEAVYTIRELGNSENKPFDLAVNERGEHWEFYIPVEAVPFVPRQGGSKKSRKLKKSKNLKKSKKMRRKA